VTIQKESKWLRITFNTMPSLLLLNSCVVLQDPVHLVNEDPDMLKYPL